MVQKIALEEHVMTPGLAEYWLPTMSELPKPAAENFFNRLNDFGGRRIEEMDKGGITKAVLSVAGPGVQAERDAALATKKSREANDQLAVEIQKHPDRYAGFAHIAVQDPKNAADELERCIRDLKFCGVMINGHTNGMYLDNALFDPFWERVNALGATVYIHPADPVSQMPVLEGFKVLSRPMWGWGVETGSHALRLIVGGHFERFPNAKLMLGHLGETLPFLLWRLDSRAKFQGLKLPKPPSDYIKRNVFVTTSGMCALEPLRCSIDAMGLSNVLFAADYPFEDAAEAGHWMDTVAISDAERAAVAYDNAVKVLKL